MEKLKTILANKKFMVFMALAVMTMALGATCFASGESVASQLDFTGITTALTDAVTPADILAIIAKVIVIGIPFVLAWFGFRFLWSKFRGAVTRGRM